MVYSFVIQTQVVEVEYYLIAQIESKIIDVDDSGISS